MADSKGQYFTDDRRAPPSEEELIGYLDTLSNWGRWGDGEQGLGGTLNLLSEARTASVVSTLVSGHVIPCGLPIPFAGNEVGRDASGHLIIGDNEYPLRYMIRLGELEESLGRPGLRASPHDGFLMEPHGRLITHLDAPMHTVLDGTMFNGVVAEGLLDGRARLGTVELAERGITGRGVLLDVAQSSGVPWLDDGDRVFPEDLERCEEAQGVRVREGDILVVRTGYRGRTLTGPKKGPGYRRPGMQAACLPWLRERDISVIASDVPTDCFPAGYELGLPIHTVGMWAMGLWIVDNCYLEELATHCHQTGRYDFLWTIAPLRLSGMSCSPVNPLALF